MITPEKLDSLFFAIYQDSKNEADRKAVEEIVNKAIDDGDAKDAATDICDYFGIERRHNRAEIMKVIIPLFVHQ